jgi:23S rRNA pseudouridine1911/1915/1917 synthase
VTVDGRVRSKSFRLRGGETVVARRASARAPGPAPAAPAIVWESDELLVVDKPAGLVVHPAPGHRATTLVELLAERAGGAYRPRAVHRLDRDTSGLLIVAKTEPALDELRQRLRRREIVREYVALVRGRLESRGGTIEAPLGRDARDRTRMTVAGTGRTREARTHFEVERFLARWTLVRVRLETGRTHQIRAHFAAIGHPLCGDRPYGEGPALGLARQFLHSARLRFCYSRLAEPLELRSKLPPDLEGALREAAAEVG